MAENNSGCLNWVGLAALIIGIYIWVGNVDTIKITEQLPPPQDSWDVVYPKFRDEVSSQLLNTQLIAGSVLNATSDLKTQNADLQYSVDLLLNNLGILKEQAYEESIRQRNEQRIMTVASIIFGWLLGAFITKDSFDKLRKRFASQLEKRKQNSNNKSKEKSNIANNISRERIRTNPITANHPIASSRKLSQTTQPSPVKLCPRCSKPMEIRTSPRGKQFFVCPNFQQCRQFFPVE